MSRPGERTSGLGAQPAPAYSVEHTEPIYRGRVFALRSDRVRMPDGTTATREILDHPGAVGIVALDEAERVVLLRQYRHSVPGYLWELPAGLLDVEGEPAAGTAARELYEEASLRAETWHTMVDLRTSPGFSDEAVRVFLARGLTDVDGADRYVGGEEEADLTVVRIPLAEAVAAVVAGEIENSIAVAGILAADHFRQVGWRGLRAPDVPWPARPAH